MPMTQTVADEKSTVSRRSRLIAAAVVLIALTSAGAMAARRYLTPSVAAETTGTLVVNTDPAGAEVVIDGRQRGVTPITLSLSSGQHVLELAANGGRRTIPVTITANGEVSQFIELPKTVAAVGHLQVRTEPTGAKVTVDGQLRGTAPLTVDGLAPGRHAVTLENDLGSVSEDVMIEAGTTASLVVPLRGPQGAPVSGWVSVATPVEVQLYENDRLLGSSRTDRIMVSVGRHDLVIVNEALGYRLAQTIQVTPGQVARIKPDWPQGTIAINALPWAEVWIDGQRIGETPIGNTPIAIGPHEVLFRHPDLGEQNYKTTVTLATPARLSVDLRKK